MTLASTFARRNRPHVQAEPDAVAALEARGEPVSAFAYLEHVRVHCAMLGWSAQRVPVRPSAGAASRRRSSSR